MRIAGTEPRAVDPAHHLSIVKSIVGNLKVLEESGMFDDIGLYSRSEQRLFSSADDEEPASEALERILFGAWTAEESAHYEYLKQRLEQDVYKRQPSPFPGSTTCSTCRRSPTPC